MRHPLVSLMLPDGLIVLAAAVLLRWPALLEPGAPVLPALPPLVLVVGAALALRFARGRVLLGLVVLALADRALLLASAPPASRSAVALLVPLNLLALGTLPERGVLTAATLRRATAIAAQVVVAMLLTQPDEAEVAALLDARFLPRAVTTWSALGDAALLAFGAGLAVLAVRFVLSPDATTRGFFWALLAAFLAFSVPDAGRTAALAPSTFLFATAGLVLSTAVIEASHAMAYRDALTGLPGRRAFDEALRATEGVFTVAMVDVDHFKRCNDTYGHDVGDQVLRMVATALGRVSEGGRPYRYGGEEFAVLFPERHLEACLPALEDVRAAVERTSFTLRGADRPRKRPRKPARRARRNTVAVTVSIGAADRTPPDTPPDVVVRAADEALYRAKKAGRNRIGHRRS